METRQDALGNEIVLGGLYGYSVDRNGFTSTTIGEAVRFTDSGMCTLKPIQRKRALWMDPAEEEKPSKSVTVKPAKLFPVDKNLLK